ncbi:5360_t:CDS:1, partial [Cetraspora pellucida]
MNQEIDKPYQCTLCQVKRFATIKGLYQHETYKHKDYKLPPSNLPYLLPDAIQQFRETLVFFIKRKLSLNFKKSGRQSIKISCSESQFIGVFGSWIHRYSP